MKFQNKLNIFATSIGGNLRSCSYENDSVVGVVYSAIIRKVKRRKPEVSSQWL